MLPSSVTWCVCTGSVKLPLAARMCLVSVQLLDSTSTVQQEYNLVSRGTGSATEVCRAGLCQQGCTRPDWEQHLAKANRSCIVLYLYMDYDCVECCNVIILSWGQQASVKSLIVYNKLFWYKLLLLLSLFYAHTDTLPDTGLQSIKTTSPGHDLTRASFNAGSS